MKFGCPYCHTFVEKDDSAAGSIIPCPNCGREFQVGILSTEASPLPIAAKAKPSSKSRVWSWIALVLILLLVWRIVSNINENRYRHEMELAEQQYKTKELEGNDGKTIAIWTAIGGIIVTGLTAWMNSSNSSSD
jgi:hypothetical protein